MCYVIIFSLNKCIIMKPLLVSQPELRVEVSDESRIKIILYFKP